MNPPQGLKTTDDTDALFIGQATSAILTCAATRGKGMGLPFEWFVKDCEKHHAQMLARWFDKFENKK